MYKARSLFAGRMLAVGLCLVLLSGTAAFGEIFHYPDVSATSVEYSMITESSFTDSGALFGPPMLTGHETLRYESGMNFGSYSAGAGDFDITDGKLYMKLEAKTGARIAAVTLNEIGAYAIGGVGGTSATQVSVSTLGLSVAVNRVRDDSGNILSVDGPVVIGQMRYHLVTDGDDTDGQAIPSENDIPLGPGVSPVTFPISTHGQGTWTGYAVIDLIGALQGTPWEGHDVMEATLVFDNMLITQSEAGTFAYIDKKRLWITPEPGTVMLLSIGGLGLAGLSWCKRRRSTLKDKDVA